MLRRSVAYRIQNPKEAHDAHLQTTEVGLKQTARGISVARAGRGEGTGRENRTQDAAFTGTELQRRRQFAVG